MISLDSWAEIRHLRSQGLSIRAIAAQVGCAKRTVERALACDSPPSYKKRVARSNAFAAVEPLVRALLAEYPRLAASVLAERVGWKGSGSWFRENVARIRPEYIVQDPVDTLVHVPGQQIQCDLTFLEGGLPGSDGVKRAYPVLVMVASYSRFMGARVLPTRQTGDLLAGMWSLLESCFDAVPDHFLWDHESGIGQRRLSPPVAAFAGCLGSRVRQAPVRDPESKGIVERANRYLKTSFFPGRRFSDVKDVQAQLDEWLGEVANQRLHRATHMVVAHAWQKDKEAMKPLSIRPEVGRKEQIRLPRNYYVTVDTNRYSVHPSMIGRIVTVRVDLGRVEILSPDGSVVGSHQRLWAKNQMVTDPAHHQAAVAMRQHLKLIPPQASPGEVRVAQADLGAYDRLAVIA